MCNTPLRLVSVVDTRNSGYGYVGQAVRRKWVRFVIFRGPKFDSSAFSICRIGGRRRAGIGMCLSDRQIHSLGFDVHKRGMVGNSIDCVLILVRDIRGLPDKPSINSSCFV